MIAGSGLRQLAPHSLSPRILLHTHATGRLIHARLRDAGHPAIIVLIRVSCQSRQHLEFCR